MLIIGPLSIRRLNGRSRKAPSLREQNVRDLKQLVTRIVQRHVGPGPVTAGDIPEGERPGAVDEMKGWRNEGLEGVIRLAIASGTPLKEIERVALALRI
jgi:hypothetical protein